MSQPSGEGKRGRKASNEWNYKCADDTQHKVTVSLQDASTLSKDDLFEFAVAGIRAAAYTAFQREFRATEASVGPNKESLQKAIQFFLHPPEEMKGKIKPAKDENEARDMAMMQLSIMSPDAIVFELPTTWRFNASEWLKRGEE